MKAHIRTGQLAFERPAFFFGTPESSRSFEQLHKLIMTFQRVLCLSCVVALASSTVGAFAFHAPHLSNPSTSHYDFRTASTCLRAAEDGTSEAAQDKNEKGAATKAAAADDILNSPAFLKRKLDVLKSDIDKTEQDIADAKQRYDEGKAEWGDQFDELAREYQQIQDRMNSQSKNGDGMATVQVARHMLDALDNFDRAFGSVEAESDFEKEVEAKYKAAYDLILETFKKLGVEQVETVGVEFDYEFHQAVMQKPSEEYEEGIVCEELAKGFKLNDQLIRAAMVVVAV
jgi:molecular chaperone GrpE